MNGRGWKSWIFAGLLVGGLVGCGATDNFDQTQGSDEAEAAQSESALVSSEADDADDGSATSTACSTLTPEEHAQRAAERASLRFAPQGCVTATASGPTVTYQLNHCTGRFGLRDATGTVTVTFSQDQDATSLHATAQDLVLARAVANLDVNASCSLDSAGLRHWAVKGHLEGTSARGIHLSHDGDYTLVVDRAAHCGTLNGDWVGTRDTLERKVEVTDLKRCVGACPAAGGKIVVDRPNGVVLTIDFDGSNVATWSDTAGHAGTRTLACGT